MPVRNNFHKYYLEDLVALLREDALKAKENRDKLNDDYSKGYLAAMRDVIISLKQQAISYEDTDFKLNLNDIVPERDLT